MPPYFTTLPTTATIMNTVSFFNPKVMTLFFLGFVLLGLISVST